MLEIVMSEKELRSFFDADFKKSQKSNAQVKSSQ